jgi:hypothetical protein
MYASQMAKKRKAPKWVLSLSAIWRVQDSFFHVVPEWAYKGNSPKKLRLLCNLIFYFCPQDAASITCSQNKKLLDFSRSFFVARAGLEPATFGL